MGEEEKHNKTPIKGRNAYQEKIMRMGEEEKHNKVLWKAAREKKLVAKQKKRKWKTTINRPERNKQKKNFFAGWYFN